MDRRKEQVVSDTREYTCFINLGQIGILDLWPSNDRLDPVGHMSGHPP